MTYIQHFSLSTVDILAFVRSGDYMATLAKVHCGCREWQVPGALSVTV